MPPVQTTPVQAPAPVPTPITTPPVTPPPAPTPVASIVTPPPPPKPVVSGVMAEPHHPHTILIALSTFILGLALGAAASYYYYYTSGSDIIDLILGQPAPVVNMDTTDQAAIQQQAAAQATASSYTQVDTNPLSDVQTNPF